MLGRPCARRFDKGFVHCSGFVIASASNNVLVNGRGCARLLDRSSVHLRPMGWKCRPHVSRISKASRTVKVNGRGCARQFDRFSGCTAVASGSKNVLVGG